MKFKKGIAVVMAAATLLTASVPTTVYADSPSMHEPMPCYELLSTAVPMLAFDGATAYCECTVYGEPSVVQITVVQKLQKYWGLWIWNDVSGATWTKTDNDSLLSMQGIKTVSESGKYRTQLEITMTNSDGSTETVTVYSKEVDVTL